MNRQIVAISDCDHVNIREEEAVFSAAGIECRLFQCMNEDDLIRNLGGYAAVVNQYAPMTGRVFDALPDLKFIVRYGVGVNNIDLVSASRHGIAVCNVPDYGVQEVASHALALLLALTRKIVPMTQSVRSGRWDYAESIPIFRHAAQTIGIVGLGRIGSCFARLVRPLAGRILAVDPRYEKAPGDCADFVTMTDFSTLLRESDAISIHCPLETTRHLFDAAALAQMKPTAYLINVSRGGIIEEDSLADALNQGRLAGAAIDVTEIEPLLADSPLRSCERLLVTPHIAWYSVQSSSDLKTKAAQEAVRFLRDEPLKNRINPL